MNQLFDTLYHIIRITDLEGILQFSILSYVLFLLCGCKYKQVKTWHYVLGSTLFFSCIQFLALFAFPITHTTIIGTNTIPYWFGFVSCISFSILFAHLLLENNFAYKMTYILFYMAFIMLYKIVCSPLYELETQIAASLYQIVDIITLVIQFFLLFLLTLLFRKHQIHTSIQISKKGMIFTLYFPLSILVCYTLSSNSLTLYRYTNPMIALIILSDLPMIYYILCMIMKSYEEQRKLDDALTQTKAQLARFRFSIELQEQLKKERHELKNNYFYIQTLLNEKKYDALNDYMDNVIGEKLSNLNEIETGNILMDYLLNRKVQEAHKYHIKTYVEVLVPSQLNVSEDILCTILLNLLDNAIEASQKEENPDLHITINCAKNYLVCKIRNKASEAVLAKNPKLKTTKKNSSNHGLGLKIIRHAVRRCNGIFQVSNEEGYFTATVMLPMKEQ